jgi:CheY-like chemotaxis protein
MVAMGRVDLARVAQDTVETLRTVLPPELDVRLSAQRAGAAVGGDPAALRRLVTGLALQVCGERPGAGRLHFAVAAGSPASPAAAVDAAAAQHCLVICYAPVTPDAAPAAISTVAGGELDSEMSAILAAHGARLEWASRGGSVEVRLCLAAAPEHRSSARLRREGVETPVGRLPSGSETVLVVDDDETLRRTGKRILERLGYRVLLAADGMEALDVYAAHAAEVALVITDVRMPRLGGLELLERLHADGRPVKVLIASGSTTLEQEGEARARGAPVISKPWSLADFARQVRRTLDGG